jgi:hypothetical protein
MKEKYPDKPDDFLWNKIAIVDTENGSGELYVNGEFDGTKVGVYNAITLTPPFEVSKYIQAIKLCEEAGMEVCILDSTSHAWSGEGGLLEQQGAITKRIGNSWTAWRDITPQHNKFVETMLQSPMHIIATMRAKQEYVQDKDQNGKAAVKKLGLEPEQRKGMEYEFTTFLEISSEHEAFGAKDRTSIFDQRYFKITPNVGREFMRWLNSGSDATPVVVATSQPTSHPADKKVAVSNLKSSIISLCKELGGSADAELMKLVKSYAPNGNPNSITDEEKLSELHSELMQLKTSREFSSISQDNLEPPDNVSGL